MLKIILPTKLAFLVEPHLPQDTIFIYVNPDGDFDGAIVDEEALLTALRQNWIAGAGLDTFITNLYHQKVLFGHYLMYLLHHIIQR